MAEVTFSDFAKFAKRRGHNPESLAELFQGKIEDPREFFERVMAGKFKHEDPTAVVIPYRSVINWHRQHAARKSSAGTSLTTVSLPAKYLKTLT